MSNLAMSTANEIECSEEPVVLVGREQTITYANAAAHRLLGYTPGQLTGLSLKWLSPPSRHGELRNVEALFAGQTSRRIRSVALRADGKSVDVTVGLEPCADADGKVVAVVMRYDDKAPQHSMIVPRLPITSMRAPVVSVRPSQPPKAPTSGTPTISARPKVKVPPHGPRALKEASVAIPPPPPPTTKPVSASTASNEELRERLDSALQLLGWLDGRFASENDPGLDDARERQRLSVVLQDAKSMVQECRRDLDTLFPAIPRAPKLPQIR